MNDFLYQKKKPFRRLSFQMSNTDLHTWMYIYTRYLINFGWVI